MRRIQRVFILSIMLIAPMTSAQPDRLTKAVEFARKGQFEKAITELSGAPDEAFTKEERHLKYFALGYWAHELRNWGDAKTHLQRALELENRHAAAIEFLLGNTAKNEGRSQDALKHYANVLKKNPAQNIEFMARFEYSEVGGQTGAANQSAKHLKFLERRWRNTPRYPEVVWQLIGNERKRRRQHVACRWARKMYSKYAAHPLVADWGAELHNNVHEGEKLNCFPSKKDIRDRIRTMQQAGMHDRARAELEIFRASHSDPYEIDMLMITHLDMQGHSDDALTLLLKYFSEKQSHVPYLNLLGRLAARAQDPHLAIYAYDKVAAKTRGSRGRKALFYSGFLRYQMQDYDGAHRRFKEVMRKYPGSSQARDAKWYWAWIRYLKGNYIAAERAFRDLYDDKIYLRRRRVRYPFRDDRTQYWMAMSVYRQGRLPESRPLFEKIVSRNETSYYAVLSRERLQEIPVSPERRLASVEPAQEKPAEPVETMSSAAPMVLFSPNGEREGATEDDTAAALNVPALIESGEEEDAEAAEAEIAKEEGDFEEGEENAVEAAGELLQVTSFRDPKLQSRFQRARDLIVIGLDDWAKWELFEIERRTRNKSYLRTLMASYARIGSYNRAARISEMYFSGERSRAGMQGDRELWEYNYPRAYANYVEKASAQFDVPEALVLSIMRAESHFNREAISPVGARGLMQVMPYTANQVRRLLGESAVEQKQLFEPELNIRLGTRYLSRLKKKFKDLVPLVAAGYNAGPHRVNSWVHDFGSLQMDEFIEHVPFLETRNYMKKVIRYMAMYTELYSQPRAFLSSLTKAIPLRVETRPSPRENWESLD